MSSHSLLQRAILKAGGLDRLLANVPPARRWMLRQWAAVARPEQLAPRGDWSTWLILAGRGWGKTRTGAEWVRDRVESGAGRRLLLIGPTASDVRDVMVEGPSGILATASKWARPLYEPGKARITWPNGTIALLRSAETPNRMRGPQYDTVWADELAAWKYPDAWDQIQLGLRLGDPRACVTTTPRPTPQIKELLRESGTHVTKGSTYDNAANLAKRFIEKIRRLYEGTRLGRQEIHADVLDDNPNALWKLADIDSRRRRIDRIPELKRVVVAVDPAVSANPDSDETGIVVAGLGPCNCRGDLEQHAFVLESGDSGIYTPKQWADLVIKAYDRHEADKIIGEVNQGGDLVEANIMANANGRHLPFKKIHASKSKQLRHEPVAALYEQRKVHHVGGHAKLEDEQTQWDPTITKSPNRLDAVTIALTELLVEPPPASYRRPGGSRFRTRE